MTQIPGYRASVSTPHWGVPIAVTHPPKTETEAQCWRAFTAPRRFEAELMPLLGETDYAPLGRVQKRVQHASMGRVKNSSTKTTTAGLWQQRPARRVRARLSQEQLAEMTGLNPRTIQKIEAGDINILVTTLAKLQAAIGCSWGDLLGSEPKRRRPLNRQQPFDRQHGV